MCLQDCQFCTATIEGDTASVVKERGKEHLETEHYDEFAATFADDHAGNTCRGECGYAYPTTVEEVAGFNCPSCGHDHFDSFADRYLYWQIELE